MAAFSKKSILKNYKIANILIKIATLSDYEFKAVLKDPKLQWLLDGLGLLDDFYLSMPDKTSKEISNLKSTVVDGVRYPLVKNIENNQYEKLMSFISECKEETIDPIILNSYFGSEDSPESVFGIEKENLYDKKISEVLISYYNIFGYTDKFDQFIDNYRLIPNITQKTREELKKIYNAIVNSFSYMLSGIISFSDIRSDITNNISIAEKFRNSDIFDVVKRYISKTDNNDIYEEIARIPRTTEHNKSSTKPDVPVIRYDTGEDSTKKE